MGCLVVLALFVISLIVFPPLAALIAIVAIGYAIVKLLG